MAHLIGQTKIPAADNLLAGSAPDPFPTLGGSWGDCHGIVHPAVWGSAGLRLPLLRSHRHIRLPERLVATRAGSALLPQQPAPAKAGVVGVATVSKEVLSQRTAATRPGWKPTLATIGCRSSGPRSGCARKIMFCPGN